MEEFTSDAQNVVHEDVTININETIVVVSPTVSPTVENIDAAEETHQFDADAALLLNITLICCTMLVRKSLVCVFSPSDVKRTLVFIKHILGILRQEEQVLLPTRVRRSNTCWNIHWRSSSPNSDRSHVILLQSRAFLFHFTATNHI